MEGESEGKTLDSTNIISLTHDTSSSPPAQVKVFQQSSGFCFVTFSEHTAPVTAVQFLPSGHALVSASLDGTVRAFDLVRWVGTGSAYP